MMTKRYYLFVLALCAAGFVSSGALAANVSITQAQTLTFPTIGLPSGGGSASLSVSPLNSSTSGNGQIITGIASRGQYNLSVTGAGNSVSVSIDVTGVNTGNAGLTLNNFRGFYASQTIDGFPSSTLPLPAKSPATTPLYLGAQLTADSSVMPGNYSAGFSITVFIQ